MALEDSTTPIPQIRERGAPRTNVKAVRPFRIAWRLAAYVLWTGLCYVSVVATFPLGWIVGERARRLRRRIAIRWSFGVGTITGMKLEVHGKPPEDPYFMVSNHVVWLDGFAMIRLAPCTYVGMAEIQSMPIIGTLVRGFEPIFVYRKKEDTPRVLGLMEEQLRSGGSLFMCPEAVISPGHEVKRFRGGLLQTAINTSTPVHYVSITYRTPEDTPPPSQCILFGPDPYYRTADGQIPPDQLEAWGPEKSQWRYLTRFLSVTGYTVVLRFGEEPVSPEGLTKHQLADALCDHVRELFTPVE